MQSIISKERYDNKRTENIIGLFLGFAIPSESPAESAVVGTVYCIEVDSTGVLVQIERASDSKIVIIIR